MEQLDDYEALVKKYMTTDLSEIESVRQLSRLEYAALGQAIGIQFRLELNGRYVSFSEPKGLDPLWNFIERYGPFAFAAQEIVYVISEMQRQANGATLVEKLGKTLAKKVNVARGVDHGTVDPAVRRSKDSVIREIERVKEQLSASWPADCDCVQQILDILKSGDFHALRLNQVELSDFLREQPDYARGLRNSHDFHADQSHTGKSVSASDFYNAWMGWQTNLKPESYRTTGPERNQRRRDKRKRNSRRRQ